MSVRPHRPPVRVRPGEVHIVHPGARQARRLHSGNTPGKALIGLAWFSVVFGGLVTFFAAVGAVVAADRGQPIGSPVLTMVLALGVWAAAVVVTTRWSTERRYATVTTVTRVRAEGR